MKHLFKLSLLLLALLIPATASAYDFVVGGIYYNRIGDNQVAVTNSGIYNHENPLPSYTGNVTIPEYVTYEGTTYSVTSIGYCAFYFCSALTSVIIPNSVTSIEDQAFRNCSDLTSVAIPNSITYIGGGAFLQCIRLNDVFSFIDEPTTVSMGSFVFYQEPNYYAIRTLHVPVGTVSAYQADTKWSEYFGSIVEMEPDPVLAESIKLNVTTAGLNEGATLQLTATVLPENSDKTVLWASNNPSVATVNSNGLVTTHSVGTATITASTTDGSNLSTSCTVTLLPVGVKGDVNGDKNITISEVTSLIYYLLMGHWPEP